MYIGNVSTNTRLIFETESFKQFLLYKTGDPWGKRGVSMIRMERLLWIQVFLSLMILFAGTNGWREVKVNLGDNIKIPCFLKRNETVFWYKQHETQSPMALLRSVAFHFAFYYANGYKNKYFLQPDKGLFINNVTEEDCVLYYCGYTENTSMIFDNATKLVSVRQPGTTDQSETKNRSAETSTGTGFSVLDMLTFSAVLNGILLLLLVIGSRWIYVLRGKTFTEGSNLAPLPGTAVDHEPQVSTPSDHEPQYEMINLTPTSRPRQVVQCNTIYSKVKLPTNSATQPYPTPDDSYTLAVYPST